MEYVPRRKPIRPGFPLLRLPSELIEYIFELAYEDEKPTGPLPRALLPSYTSARYRQIEISTHKQLRRLMEVVKRTPKLGQLVKELTIELDRHGLEFYGISSQDFSYFLDGFPHLRTLSCFLLPPYLDQVVFRHLHQKPLPKLNVLVLAIASDGDAHDAGADVDEQQFLEILQHSPNLTNLQLQVDSLSSTFLSAPSASIGNAITSLTLFGWHFCSRLAFPLQERFPALVELRLRDFGGSPDFESTLARAPVSIRRLRLQSSEPHYGPKYPLDDVLPRFAQLEHLELCGGSFTPERLLPFLRSLASLSSLTFGPAAPVTDALLLSIVSPPTHLPSLRTLTLDYVENLRGHIVERPKDEVSGRSDEDDWSGWVRPDWNSDCTPYGLSCVILAAFASGIVLEGTALGAEKWEEDCYEHYDNLLMHSYQQEEGSDETKGDYGRDEDAFWLEEDEEKQRSRVVFVYEGGSEGDSDASEDESGGAWSDGEWGVSGMYCDEWN